MSAIPKSEQSRVLITSSSQHIEGATTSSVWNIWKDISNWPSWDHNFNKTILDGEFDIDSKITIFHKQFPTPTVLRICHIIENFQFFTESFLSFGHVTVEREVIADLNGVKITHSFYLLPSSEEMKKMFEDKIASNVRNDFQNAVNNIAKILEARQLEN
jgi:hypothetical protein